MPYHRIVSGPTWNAMAPPDAGSSSSAQFSTQFAVDPNDSKHVMIAGSAVDESGSGPGTSSSDWKPLIGCSS